MFENHAHDSRYTGPLTVAQTVSQLFGTGGNNTPLIVESICQPQDASIPEPTVINSSGGGIAETLDASYWKGAACRGNREREFVVIVNDEDTA